MQRALLVGAGALLVITALLMSPAWFVPIPNHEDLPPAPMSGFVLVQVALFANALVLLWFGLRRRKESADPGRNRALLPAGPVEETALSRTEWWLLAGVTLLGLGLRLIALDTDLWLDEISPIINYRDASAWKVAITYNSSNNHLLNTLLVKASMALLGEREWAIRLPAMLWGTATIPVLYWVARQVLSRHASLCAALLLAVSYHHIFFSQNARGYTAYVCLSLLSSVLLVKGLSDGRARVWAAFVVTTVLNFLALLISGFVFAAHIVVGGLAVWAIKRAGGAWKPTLKHLGGVFALATLLGFQLYAAVLPQMYVLMRPVYSDPSSGYSLFSLDLLAELSRGLVAGFGPGLLLGAIPFLVLAMAGYIILLRRHWVLALSLTLPCLLQATLLVVQGFTFSPRFFILALPLAILVAVQAIAAVAENVARLLKRDQLFSRWVQTAVVALLCVASLAALPSYYATPKQPYRAALAYVEEARQPDGLVVVIMYAAAGTRYYLVRTGIGEGGNYFYSRTVETFDEILRAHPGRPVSLLTTFPRAIRILLPDLQARIEQGWEIERTFPATIGDGHISIWRPKQ